MKKADLFTLASEARREAYVTAVMAPSTGMPVAGLLGGQIPREVFYAMGILPITVASTDGHAMEFSLRKDFCDLLVATEGYALSEKCPLLFASQSLIADDFCSRRCQWLQGLSASKPSFIYHSALRSAQGEDGSNHLLQLIEFLETTYHRSFQEEELKKVIQVRQNLREKREKLFEQSQGVITGQELKTLFFGLEYQLTLESADQYLDACLDVFENQTVKGSFNKETELLGVFDLGLIAQDPIFYPKGWPAWRCSCEGDPWVKVTEPTLKGLSQAYGERSQTFLKPEITMGNCSKFSAPLKVVYGPEPKLQRNDEEGIASL